MACDSCGELLTDGRSGRRLSRPIGRADPACQSAGPSRSGGVPAVDVADDLRRRRLPEPLRATSRDPGRWGAWSPGLTLVVDEDRGTPGVRWLVAAASTAPQRSGSSRCATARCCTVPARGEQRGAGARSERTSHWALRSRALAFGVKDALEAGRHARSPRPTSRSRRSLDPCGCTWSATSTATSRPLPGRRRCGRADLPRRPDRLPRLPRPGNGIMGDLFGAEAVAGLIRLRTERRFAEARDVLRGALGDGRRRSPDVMMGAVSRSTPRCSRPSRPRPT